MKKALVSFVGFTLLLTFPLLLKAGDKQNLRNQRYCEVILSHTIPLYGQLKLNVYNTLGLNDCPNEIWSKLSVEKVKKTTGAPIVVLNGPRYFVMDAMKDTEVLNPTPVQFDGLGMRLAGILTLSVMDYKRALPYQPRSVHRHTTWVYAAHRPIYELVDPTGKRYVMQSYSVEKIPQSMDDLRNLGKKLTLPEGWSFSTRTLKKTAYLTALDQETLVIQDDFLNTYQIETASFTDSYTDS